ncbi:hypothetical protein ACO0SA_000845 [Hanseniaspora valbyensis]
MAGVKRSNSGKDQKITKKQRIVKKNKNLAEASESESSSSAGSDISLSSDEEEVDKLDNSSDDELDELDEHDELEDDELDEAVKGEKSGPSSAAAAHLEQKKLMKERKLKRSSGYEIESIKKLWEKLRAKDTNKKEKTKLCDEIWELASDSIADLVLKHDASRVVQSLIKYSDVKKRDTVVKALKGKYTDLAKSSYGKYLLVKLLHYGSKDSRQLIIDELHGNLRKLMRHREGAYVVEDLFVLYANQKQRNQMLQEFWGSEYAAFAVENKDLTIEDVCKDNVDKRRNIQRNLSQTITAAVEKGSTGFQLLHAVMKEYTKIINLENEEFVDFVELVSEPFAELIHTPEGAYVANFIVSHSNAKQRKNILKHLKDHLLNLIKNEYGNMVFTNLLMTVDDTVLMGKLISTVVSENLHHFITEKYARRPFLYLVTNYDNGSYFNPLLVKQFEQNIEWSKNTSKKPFLNRKNELLKKLIPCMLNNYLEHIKTALNSNLGSQFISELIINDEIFEMLDEKTLPIYEACINKTLDFYKGDVANDDLHPLNAFPFSQRFVKSIIQNGKWDRKEKKLIPLTKTDKFLGLNFAQKLYSEVITKKNLVDWCNNKNSSFVIVSLYEIFEKKDSENEFFTDLKKVKKSLNKVEDDGDNKGLKLLLSFMK